jgi:mono/diheme cytochrome c family protein
MFPDNRCNRGEILGTVARGSLQADETFYQGLENGQWTLAFPKQLDVNEAFVRRGQGRYNIYCAPCHGHDGRGAGAVPQRLLSVGAPAWSVRNLVDPAATPARMPNGQMFNTISNGFNTMMGYAQQIPHADRWAIIAYVRALQRSFNATLEDVRPDKRGSMPAPPVPPAAPPAAPPASTAPPAGDPAAPTPAPATTPPAAPAPAGGAR